MLTRVACCTGAAPTVMLQEFAQLASEFDSTAATAEAALEEVSTDGGAGHDADDR